MNDFWNWLTEQRQLGDIASRLRLLENYYELPTAEYNKLFEDELEKLIDQHKGDSVAYELEAMTGFDWTSYIATAVRNSGVHDQREVQETTHEIVSRLLMGKLFRGYNPEVHGPIDRRFKRSVGNAVRNVVEKEKNRRRYLPSGDYEPDEVAASREPNDEQTVEEFREFVRGRLGGLALAVLDLRLSGEGDTKSLVGADEYGRPTSYRIKKIVQEIKELAREFAAGRDPGFLGMVERAMAGERETVARRFAGRVG